MDMDMVSLVDESRFALLVQDGVDGERMVKDLC